MKLRDAMKAGSADPETPQPINAGRCEAPAGSPYPRYVICGARGRWWRWNQFRCNKHKDTRA